MGNSTYIRLEEDQFAGSTLVAPNPFYGQTGQLALDLWLNDPEQHFRKVGWLHSSSIYPFVAQAPLDWMPRTALAHPVELYCNGQFTILQIRSKVRPGELKQLFKDLALWALPKQFHQLLILSTNLIFTRAIPDGEDSFCLKSQNCTLDLGVSEYHLDEGLKEMIQGEDFPLEILETPPLPIAILFSSDLRLFDFQGAEALVRRIAETWKLNQPVTWPESVRLAVG